MKFSIQINQYAAQESFEDLTISDLSIFDLFTYMQGSPSSIYKIVDDKKYILMHYKFIISQLPILKIKTRQGVYKKLSKLEEAGLLIRLDEGKKNGDSYYCSGKNYDLMFIKYIDQKVATPVTTSQPQLPSSNSSSQGGNSSSQDCQPQLPNSELELHNKVVDRYNKEDIKESEGTRSNDLNSIQEKAGNKSYDDPLSGMTATVKNKYHLLKEDDPLTEKTINDELGIYLWNGLFDKYKNDVYPERWKAVRLQIKKFITNLFEKGHLNNQFYDINRRIENWIQGDINKWECWPNHEWNKTKEDITSNAKLSDEMPKGFDKRYLSTCEGKQLTEYKKHLYSQGYTSKYVPTEGTLWFKDHKRVN